MKRILSTILCLAITAATISEKSFAFNYIPTNTDDPSCIDVRRLDASDSYISYKGTKEVCGCKTCEARAISYMAIKSFLDEEKTEIISQSQKMGERISTSNTIGNIAEGVVNWIEVPAANVNKILANFGLKKLSCVTTVLAGVSGAGALICIGIKHGIYHFSINNIQKNLKINESIFRQLSLAIDNKAWQNNNFILVVMDNRKPSVAAVFKNKPGLKYENITFGEDYFNGVNDELKLLIISMDPNAQAQLQSILANLNRTKHEKLEYATIQQTQFIYNNLKDSYKNDTLNDLKVAASAGINFMDTYASYKKASEVASAKEKEKLEKTQSNTKEAGTQTQNDQATQTETKGTQANTNTNANASTTENKLTDKMEKAIKDKVEQSVNKATTEKALQSNNAKVEKPAVNVDVKSTTAQKAELTNTAKNNAPKPNENKSSSIFKNPFNSDKENASKFEASINVNTSKQIDDRRINIQAKPGANITFNQIIYNQTETIHNPEAATAA